MAPAPSSDPYPVVEARRSTEGAEDDGLPDDDLDDSTAEQTRNAILFVVDCNPSMFVTFPHGKRPSGAGADNFTEEEGALARESGFCVCMRAIIKTYTSKIFASPDDSLGVVLYNIDTSALPRGNNASFPNVAIIAPMDQPDAHAILTLKHLPLPRPSPTETPLGNVLWAAANMLNSLPPTTSASPHSSAWSRRVFLFTNRDNPHDGNVAVRRAATTRARDLADMGIRLEVFPLNPPLLSRRFDMFLFYRDVIGQDNNTGEGNDDEDDQEQWWQQQFPVPEGTLAGDKLSALDVRIRRREMRKRAIAKLTLSITADLDIAVRVYNVVQEAKRPQHVWMDSQTRRLVAGHSQSVWLSAGRTVTAATPLKRVVDYEYGGETLRFDADLIAELRAFGRPGLKLLRFVPAASVKLVQHHLGPAAFVVADEATRQGSLPVLVALVEELAAQNLVALCKCSLRTKSVLRLAALMPQPELVDSCGLQVHPGGFLLQLLPYREEIRHLDIDTGVDEDTEASLTEEAVDAARSLVGNLILDDVFDADNVQGGAVCDNPTLRRFSAGLQALALGEDTDDWPCDETMPDYDAMKYRAGSLLSDFLACTHADLAEGKSMKRHRSNRSSTPTSSPQK